MEDRRIGVPIVNDEIFVLIPCARFEFTYVILTEVRNERSRRIPLVTTEYVETSGDSVATLLQNDV
jgi:hypothetical protein